MAHYSRLSKVVIDVPPADHDRELAFWNAAVGEPLTQFTRHPEYHGAMLPGQDIGLLIQRLGAGQARVHIEDRKSTRLNSSHTVISYAVFCLKKKKQNRTHHTTQINQ